MLPSLLIVDDFLKDPWAARRAALALEYDPARQHGNFPGLNSSTPLDTSGVDEAVSRLVGKKQRRYERLAATSQLSLW